MPTLSIPQKTIKCRYCGKEVPAERVTKSYCSDLCASRYRAKVPRERACRHCGTTFQVITRADANRQHCSKACAKAHNAKTISTWQAEHPDMMPVYNQNRLAKNPGAWREKARTERAAIIDLLGGACIVCGASNPNWLHVDYIPTTRDKPYRHPRHLRYVRDHADEFRLLCANHHYELTLTGRIEGTEITQ